MRKILMAGAALALIGATAAYADDADKEVLGGTAMGAAGATAGAVVGGPVGAIVGGVVGFAIGAEAAVPEDASQISLPVIARMLAVGFDCTMVALAESAVLVYLLHVVNEQEEKAVNLSGTYVLRNLINRLYAG